ncbi:MAG TPA: hypothetical protein VM240_00240 [Verrucomicrobiae bacterium]|nr:hypothetical protein [Verrucomicrobiae bacterium]
MNYEGFLLVEKLKSRSWPAMCQYVDATLAAMDRWPSAFEWDGMFHPGTMAGFRQFVLCTRTYLAGEGKKRPAGMPLADFLLLKPLCEYLIREGRFPADRLDVFKEIEISSAPVSAPESGERAAG